MECVKISNLLFKVEVVILFLFLQTKDVYHQFVFTSGNTRMKKTAH